jgi:hypothetical protein
MLRSCLLSPLYSGSPEYYQSVVAFGWLDPMLYFHKSIPSVAQNAPSRLYHMRYDRLFGIRSLHHICIVENLLTFSKVVHHLGHESRPESHKLFDRYDLSQNHT